MKKLLVISSIIALTLLAACSSKASKSSSNDEAKSVATSSPTTTNRETTPVISTVLLDEKAFHGEELEAVKVINQRAKYYNERNSEKYPEIFTTDTVSSTDLAADKENKMIITKLSDPKFLSVKKELIAVSVHETYQDSPFGSEGDTVYTLKNIDGVWKIYGID
ncbi:hypothetical protein E5161_10520 [Cohnella pontilimi]|uniref:DUF4878 domain-containing protein n=1 Tax=Cohnella pontilimi TaxID=2564100 RepID=A0A4U0FCG7_9BACL|nr:hypothetical protein [Cohnella pontilimi]TJY42417.1 hypothetical protein E5161_10520 [Cohnella pontilimi]